mgnify:CR=1 FL=1
MKKLIEYILSDLGGKVATKKEIEIICRKFGEDVDNTINFMISYGYLVRILRGVYYVKTLEEFKLKKSMEILKLVSMGMDKLKVNWYFGLHTALRLNGATHEFYPTTFVLTDKIYRPKEISINGEGVKFIKLKSSLFGFGIVERDGIRFSDLEKTLLDMVYLSRYRSVPEERIISMLGEYKNKVKKKRIVEYLKFYPKAVGKVMENAGFV